jgi:hypothetical protein
MPGKLLLSVFISVSLAAAFPLWAEIEDSTELAFTVSSMPEAQLALTQAWTFPAFQGDGFLTSGNNLATALFYSLTPVSMNAGLDLTLTPVAFAQIKTGGSIGSGWNFTPLEIAPTAWGLNKMEESGSGGLISGDPFEAAIWTAYGGAVLQFDLGAVIPGNWTHILFQTYHQINYRANTLAGSGDSWSYENDGGENRNGFNYYGSYVLGYQMPVSPVLKTLAVMAEMKLKLYAEKDNDFGDELPYWIFSGIANFELSSWFNFAAITQLVLERNFTNSDYRATNKNNDVFYKERILDRGEPLSLNFFRFAAILSFKLR